MLIRTMDIPELNEKMTQNFWAKVDRSPGFGPNGDCWKWVAAIDNKGYGIIGLRRVAFKAHRVMYSIVNGVIHSNHHVLHHCDNPTCVNPKHLWLGTNIDNIRDRIEKKRSPQGTTHWTHLHPEYKVWGAAISARLHPERLARGEQHGQAKLNTDQVIEIRRRYQEECISYKKLALDYTVCDKQIRNIIQRKHWKHI